VTKFKKIKKTLFLKKGVFFAFFQKRCLFLKTPSFPEKDIALTKINDCFLVFYQKKPFARVVPKNPEKDSRFLVRAGSSADTKERRGGAW